MQFVLCLAILAGAVFAVGTVGILLVELLAWLEHHTTVSSAQPGTATSRRRSRRFPRSRTTRHLPARPRTLSGA